MLNALTHGPLGFLGELGAGEVIVILIVALLLFGHRLPEVARSAGRAVTEFKRGMREIEEDDKKPGSTESKEVSKSDEKKV
jgi:sec-independent protein translocase protein TatA